MRFFALPSMLLLAAGAAQALDDTPAQFSQRYGGTRTGSPFNRDAVVWLSADASKTYAELSAEERRRLRAGYLNLGAADEPPYPLNGLVRLNRAMREARGRLHQDGPLSLLVKVDSRGEPSTVEVLRSPSERMTRVLAGALLQEKFKPGLCAGQPCSMEFPYQAGTATASKENNTLLDGDTEI